MTHSKSRAAELEDDNFVPHKAGSEVDATEQNVKRNNLKYFFLEGTDIDKYIINNLYGRAKIRNETLDITLGENTII